LKRRTVSKSSSASVYLGDPLRGEARIDDRCDVFVRRQQSGIGARNHPFTRRNELTELHLRTAAEALLPRTIFHLQRKAEPVQSCMHRFVQNRRRHLGIGEVRIDGERELHQTCMLLMEVRAAAGEPLNHDVREIPREVPEMVGDVLLDQPQRAVESRQYIAGIDVRPRVVDDNWNSPHRMFGDARRLLTHLKKLEEVREHARNVYARAAFN